MTRPSGSRRYLKTVIALFVALIVLVVVIAAYHYHTPRPEADIDATRHP